MGCYFLRFSLERIWQNLMSNLNGNVLERESKKFIVRKLEWWFYILLFSFHFNFFFFLFYYYWYFLLYYEKNNHRTKKKWRRKYNYFPSKHWFFTAYFILDYCHYHDSSICFLSILIFSSSVLRISIWWVFLIYNVWV